MEYLGVNYKFENNAGKSFSFRISQDGTRFYAVANIIDGVEAKRIEVYPTKSNYIESPEISVNEKENFKIADKIVLGIKLKCKFKGAQLSPVSSILVLHEGFRHWVSYPFSMIGQLTIEPLNLAF